MKFLITLLAVFVLGPAVFYAGGRLYPQMIVAGEGGVNYQPQIDGVKKQVGELTDKVNSLKSVDPDAVAANAKAIADLADKLNGLKPFDPSELKAAVKAAGDKADAAQAAAAKVNEALAGKASLTDVELLAKNVATKADAKVVTDLAAKVDGLKPFDEAALGKVVDEKVKTFASRLDAVQKTGEETKKTLTDLADALRPRMNVDLPFRYAALATACGRDASHWPKPDQLALMTDAEFAAMVQAICPVDPVVVGKEGGDGSVGSFDEVAGMNAKM